MYSPKKLIERAEIEVKRDEDLFILAIASSILATFGILLNNVFLLIGAMLIAPFIDPIIAIAVFIRFRKIRQASRSILTLLLLVLVALFVSVMSYYFLTWINPDATNVVEYFLGFENLLIAFLLGIVGTLMWLWPKTSNTAAGVSIAISLIPPLSNFALSLVEKSDQPIFPSLITLVINIFGILFAALLVLFIRVRYKK